MIDQLIPDKLTRDRVVEAVTDQYKRPARVLVDGVEVDNPVSKEDFTNNILKSFLKEVTMANEANKAAEFARQIVIAKVKAEVDF